MRCMTGLQSMRLCTEHEAWGVVVQGPGMMRDRISAVSILVRQHMHELQAQSLEDMLAHPGKEFPWSASHAWCIHSPLRQAQGFARPLLVCVQSEVQTGMLRCRMVLL